MSTATAISTATTTVAAPPGFEAGTQQRGPDHSEPARSFTRRQAAITAGIGYVVLFVAAFFANFFVRERLIDATDAGATAANIGESETLFRFGLVAFLVIFAVDVVIAWALHILLRDSHRDLSLLAAWLRLTYTVFLGVGIIFFYQALSLLGGDGFLSVIPTDQLQAQALVAFEQFNATWLIGLLVFGLHLITVAWVLLRTSMAPRLLAVIMMVAGAAYITDTVAYSLLDNYADYQSLFLAMVAIPSVIGECWFGLWLLFRAGKTRSATA